MSLALPGVLDPHANNQLALVNNHDNQLALFNPNQNNQMVVYNGNNQPQEIDEHSVRKTISNVASVTLTTAKQVFLSNYLEKSSEAMESAAIKLYKFGEFASGVNNFKDAYKNMSKEAPFLDRARKAAGNAALAPLKWATYVGVASNETLYSIATTGLKLGWGATTAIINTTSPYITAAAKELINNPVPVIGTVFIGNMALSLKKDLDAISNTDSMAAKITKAGFVAGKAALIGATTMALVARYGS